MTKAKKYYAVRKGVTPGIYTSWADCQQNINGFSGAEYKGFSTEQEAKAFLASDDTYNEQSDIPRIYSKSEAVAYIDGSYNSETNEYAYGVVLFNDDGQQNFAAKFSDTEKAKSRNVAGEVEAATFVMRYCYQHNIKSVDIFYDYEGIEKWCTNAWRAKTPIAVDYKKYYNSIKTSVDVHFMKVTAHSGNKYNEVADELAKGALGIGTKSVEIHNNGIVANKIKYNDLEQIIELLKEDFSDLSIRYTDIPYGKCIELKIENPTRQVVRIECYTTNKLYFHGRREDLFTTLSNYIIELLEVDEIPKFLDVVHNMDVDHDVVESEFNQLFPNSYNKLPDEISEYLHQAVYNLHLMGNIYVANFLVEPVIRPIEGILKIALQEHGIPVREDDKEYDSFFMFKKENDKYVLKEQYIREDHTKQFLMYVGKYYTYFHNERHTLSHWDNPKNEIDTTRVLKSVSEAHTIIKDSIALIDEYYTIK